MMGFGRTGLLALFLLAGCTGAADAPPVVVTKIAQSSTTASGQPIRLPQGEVVIAMSEYVIAPGARLPVHKHPHTRLAYVDQGTLQVTLPDTGKTFTYKRGDMIVEVVDQWHSAANLGTDAVRLIVIDETPPGSTSTVMQE
jgi:quercetin dioxygenase-like cupin family protein